MSLLQQSPSRIYSQKQRAAAAEGAASPTSPHKQRGVWRWKAAAAQPHPQGIPQSLLPLSTPCLRCPRRCSWPTSATACLQRDGATRSAGGHGNRGGPLKLHVAQRKCFSF
ncbi:hypothetical protein PVAP13_2KG409305 [Panicum virgatum]|uniref:Uncharacterized protein n=1 Tax=Panicum virgatum TaxID=38727 RepID=A0A8T0W4E8_PANVG|nr:hypothetical protein PVAP13_2KG409305 [Panicum virgatum]